MKECGRESGTEVRRSTKGFTLIELLIVMIILGLLAALVGPNLFQKVAGAKQKAAKTQIEMLGGALDSFRLDVGRYPTTEEGLAALRQKPGNTETWDGPYLKKDVPPDPWGHPYVYQCPGEHGDYDLSSNGPDNQQGGEGEINSWK